jgi:hypothetical protein
LIVRVRAQSRTRPQKKQATASDDEVERSDVGLTNDSRLRYGMLIEECSTPIRGDNSIPVVTNRLTNGDASSADFFSKRPSSARFIVG